MFSDPIQITYDSVTKDLARVNQDSNGSDYFLDDGTEKYSLSIRHTIPARGASGESHMIRLDVDHFDADGLYIRRCSNWAVVKSFDNTQVSATSALAANAFAGILTTTTVTKLLGREV